MSFTNVPCVEEQSVMKNWPFFECLENEWVI